MWFESLTGFREESAQQVRNNISVNGEIMKSSVNGKTMRCGLLDIPSLANLRQRLNACQFTIGKISVQELVADAGELHADKSNAGALFQVASQFNLLEMVSPDITPEHGIEIYAHDHTQGPVCAIAAGAGTIYRNYFVNINGQPGQSVHHQIDCLADMGKALGNTDNRLWRMVNGYALANKTGLIEISKRLKTSDQHELDELRQLLRIGIQSNTEVTIAASGHTVSQAYCSALQVAYSRHSAELWAGFAQLVLDAAYEATLCAAVLNYFNTGNNKVFLTLTGGGAFGNKTAWIINAIQRALNLYAHIELDVNIVSYGTSKPPIQKLVAQFQQ